MLGALLAGCAPAAPESPTWNEDVRPILVSNCQRCHGYPPIHGAPNTFRVDVCEDWTDDEDNTFFGAGSYAEGIAFRTSEEALVRMPPRFPLSDRQVEILKNWAATGSPCGDAALLPGNRPPAFELLDESVDGALVTYDYAVADPDFEVIIGELIAEPQAGGDPVIITRELHDGIGVATWDTSTVAPGIYNVVAVIRDGSVDVEADISEYEVIP